MFHSRLLNAAVAFALLAGAFAGTAEGVLGFTINGGNYQAMTAYPGIKQFDYGTTPVRENIPEEAMVDPEFTFRITDNQVDEYFGKIGTRDWEGKQIKGVYLSQNTKGQCGVRYNKLFRYQDDWIDVKTTYLDWHATDNAKAFVNGGFCFTRWTCADYIRLRHEFFISGTDTPVNVKGFLTYTDIDAMQGLGLIPSEVRGLWTNKNGTEIKYKTTEEGFLFIKDCSGDLVDLSMGQATNARYTFSYAFEGTKHDQFILLGKGGTGINFIGFESSKVVPSDIPKEGSELIRKQVSAAGDEFKEENELRSWNAEWQYRIAALVPMETEEGNLLDRFCISDQVDECLEVTKVKILRGAGTDVTDRFDITTEGNHVIAEAKDIHNKDSTGYTYYMLLDVRAVASEENMKAHGHFVDDYTALFKNTATVTYVDGTGTYERETGETKTKIIFPYKADITVTKKIKTSDIYWDHGVPSFIINLRGTLRETQEEVEYNKAVTFSKDYVEENNKSSEYVTASVVFKDVVEGSYLCGEKETMRYGASKITDVVGGTIEENQAKFVVDDSSDRRATIINTKTNWNDYSDSQCIVNKF